jgi:hypothetical protein
VMKVLADPLSLEDRMRLGAMFEERRLERCAQEQFGIVADLSDDPALSEVAARRAQIERSS